MAKMNIFNTVQFSKPKQSRFDLTHDVKMSFRMGQLAPTCALEVIPGDKFDINVMNMLRLLPLVSPVMHRVTVSTFFFFVPNRLLWVDWPEWITGNLDVQHPYAQLDTTDEWAVGQLADYLGFPVDSVTGPLRYNPFPFAAYALIWDEYFRDQNLQDKVFVPLVAGDNNADYGPDTDLTTIVRHRAWQHDYFTSCLPFAQKGDDVLIPLTSEQNIPVEFEPGNNPLIVKPSDGVPIGTNGTVGTDGGQMWHQETNGNAALDPNGSLVVDVQSDAVNINTLRRAFRLQEFLERSARGGTRYIENILAHFGVRSSDARLQRPEFIGSVRQKMVISEVLATAQDVANDQPIGQMNGHGISVGSGRMRFRAEEHGWLIGLINVQPDTAYQQGLHRSFSRFDRFDYAWPSFANLGEQAVLNKEIYAAHSEPDGVFGYNPQYSEYRFANSRASGQMRSSLDFWHMGRIFDNEPALNEDFIKSDPTTRIFAVVEGDHIVAHVVNGINVVRKLPRFGIPTI